MLFTELLDGEGLPPTRYTKANRKTVIESDGEGLPGYTRSKKKGNDVNKCTFIVLYTGALNESDGEGCVEESLPPRCTRSKKKGI